MTSFCIFNEICKGNSSSAIFNNPAGAIHQTLTILRFLNGSNCDLRHLRVIPKNIELALSARASSFQNHAFRPNWTSLSPITIIIWNITVNFFFIFPLILKRFSRAVSRGSVKGQLTGGQCFVETRSSTFGLGWIPTEVRSRATFQTALLYFSMRLASLI